MAAGCGQVDRSGVRSKSGGRKKNSVNREKASFFGDFLVPSQSKRRAGPGRKTWKAKRKMKRRGEEEEAKVNDQR